MRDKLKGDYNYQKKRVYRKSTKHNGLTMLQLKNL